MAPLKSSYMFFVKPGEKYEFELEVLFYNNTTKGLEPISAASKTVPRDKKCAFGPVMKINAIDEEVFEIFNCKEENIQLFRSKLAPLLDSEDSMLKNVILKLNDKSTAALTCALNSVVEKFHVPESLKKLRDDKHDFAAEESETSLLEDTGDDLECHSVSLLSKNSSKRCSIQISNAGSVYGEKRAKKDTADSDATEFSDDDQSDEKENAVANKDKSGNLKEDNHDQLNKQEIDLDEREEDFTKRISDVISEARFVGIRSERCEIPSAISVNRDTVARLKESLIRHPDKTQCIVGVVRIADNDDESKTVGKFKVYVNAELFLAVQELSFEGVDFFGRDKVAAVVHTLLEGEALSAETLGVYLNKNSKEFSSQMREAMLYQDLVRFACMTVNNQGKGDDVMSFIKDALKNFGKGRNNASLFIFYACLPASYLNKFETFLRLYETGSVNGQKMSSRKLCNLDKNWNKKKDCKIEIPLNLLKLHKNVSHNMREKLIDDLLSKKIDFPKYLSTLKTLSDLTDVKKNVEQTSNMSFGEVKEKCPEKFSDKILLGFLGAKNTPAGQNDAFKDLSRHVNVALSGDKVNESEIEKPHEVCTPSDKVDILSLSKKMDQFQMIVCAMGKDAIFNQTTNHCMVEQVKKKHSGCVGIIIQDDEGALREEMKAIFDENGFVVEFIHVKRELALVSDGFQIDFQAIAVFGEKKCFENKRIKTFYNCSFKEAIHFIITDILSENSAVLYTFSEASQAVVLDPLGTMERKKISIEYMAKKNLLEPVLEKISKKMRPSQ